MKPDIKKRLGVIDEVIIEEGQQAAGSSWPSAASTSISEAERFGHNGRIGRPESGKTGPRNASDLPGYRKHGPRLRRQPSADHALKLAAELSDKPPGL